MHVRFCIMLCGTLASGTALAQYAPVSTSPAISASSVAPAPRPNIAAIAGLDHYAAENALLAAPTSPTRVVLMGDSITELWKRLNPALFASGQYIDRGISGQNTAQMLLRFRSDVIDLHPASVVILGGTNDLAENEGHETDAMIEGNLASMADLARFHGIAVVLASILPADHYFWRPGVAPAHDIQANNAWLRAYAAAHGMLYLDYFSALVSADGVAMPETYSKDGVHPTAEGFAVMRPLLGATLKKALHHGTQKRKGYSPPAHTRDAH